MMSKENVARQPVTVGEKKLLLQKRRLGVLLLGSLVLLGSVLGLWLWKHRPSRAAHTFTGTLVTPPRPIPDFVLIDQQGRPFPFGARLNTLNLLYFGYTSCPDVCPMTLADMVKVKRLLGEQASAVTFFMITVDPERDTPEALQHRLAAFDPAFIGLTGDRAVLQPIWKAFGVYAQREKIQGSATGYLVAHSSFLYLVDRHRQLRLLFAFGTAPQDIVNDIAYMLHQEQRR